MKNRSLFSIAVRRARIDRNLTLAMVATEIGISVPYLSDIEHGNRIPSGEIGEKLCQLLNVPIEVLWYSIGKLPPDVLEIEDVPVKNVIRAFNAMRTILISGRPRTAGKE